MIPPRLIPFLKPGLALGAARHAGFAHAWNWLIHSFWHLTLKCGLKWIEKWHGSPSIELRIRAGDGIDVSYCDDGWVEISSGSGKTEYEEEPSGGGGDYDEPNDIDETTHDDGDISPADGAQPDDVRPPESGAGESCNEFSEDIPNEDWEPGMDNPGDDCALLNGW